MFSSIFFIVGEEGGGGGESVPILIIKLTSPSPIMEWSVLKKKNSKLAQSKRAIEIGELIISDGETKTVKNQIDLNGRN